ncbi:helix-turn-helix domain-containing protein [Nocardiopsis sp. HNM0947]|uniref:Helix-turn-helix domain-containing protein n=1 Tax=Nocardiopsis coralli TaxID=2772213 RepID=A0ABR9P470_9ACTN|nr:PucR family transcriptional regulator [Nocardiopsis coralli]MBE2998605.1 helix-turn-helix domain-containing protein [Nocardiopsis coralli]
MTYPLRESRRSDPFAEIPPDVGVPLRALVPAMAEEALDGIRHRAEGHGAPLEPEESEQLHALLTTALGSFLERVEHPAGAEERAEGLAAQFRAYGEHEARFGRTLECLHTAMRTTAAVAWRHMADSDPRTHRYMGPIGEAIFAFQEEISTAAAQGHARVRGAGVDALRRRRTRLSRVLLGETGTEYDARAVSGLARAARWRVPERVAVALLHQEGQVEPAPLLPGEVLVDLDRAEPRALVPDPEGPGRPRALERVFRGFGVVLGPSVPLGRAPESLVRARDLAELVGSGVVAGGDVVRWDDHLPELLLSRDTGLVGAMARARLAPLSGLREQQRERMADTLLAWLESGFNANEAAERLQIHPQTVRYRMRQLEGLFGERLRDPAERFELELVLRARRLLGPLED